MRSRSSPTSLPSALELLTPECPRRHIFITVILDLVRRSATGRCDNEKDLLKEVVRQVGFLRSAVSVNNTIPVNVTYQRY